MIQTSCFFCQWTSPCSGPCPISIRVLSNYRPLTLGGCLGLLLFFFFFCTIKYIFHNSDSSQGLHKSYSHLPWILHTLTNILNSICILRPNLKSISTRPIPLPGKLTSNTEDRAGKPLIDGSKWHFFLFSMLSS